ncbi:MAG TPA: cytochrome c3 family protein, partial [Methylomirabilota bacterium]|nr:cytochrome c3 family protein [Methylomirabilota bacterium]
QHAEGLEAHLPVRAEVTALRGRAAPAIAAVVVLLGLAAGGWWWHAGRPGPAWLPGAAAPVPTPRLVGGRACGACHQEAERAWRGSHHDLAMQPATEATVLGDFNDARFTYNGVTSTFSRRDGKHVVRTDGPDGQLRDYVVSYAFGVAPLQQYLIDFPDGRKQALSIAWDSRPKDRGGQRWFHLYPEEKVTFRDELHWTARSQNWNHMCAECHSTGVRKGYDAQAGRFATTYAEVNVSCEACHGPGSNHVAWARRESGWRRLDGTKGLAIALDERRGVTWTISGQTGNAARTPPGRGDREVEMCGRCHARRSQFSDDYVHGRPLGDTHRVSLLEDRLYHPDGQIRDEVYEYGPFRQSRMFHAGVTCSDCHDPHRAKLRAAGAQVCAGCHAAQKYEVATHHFHAAGSRGADCLGCHMPTTTYMEVHARRDHGLRVPRPDLSVTLGVPDACTRCHADRSAEWAAKQVQGWYGRAPRGYQRFAEAFSATAVGLPGAAAQLAAVARDGEQPAIARASALIRLGLLDGRELMAVAGASVKDGDPLVRHAAAMALAGADTSQRIELLASLLADPVRAVRMEAARALAGAPAERLTPAQREARDRGLAEYIAGERFNADRPESHLNLGLLYSARREPDLAEAALRAALALDPRFAPASVNLADLYRAGGRDGDGERVLRAAVREDPGSGVARHALGLFLVRQKRLAEALPELEAAARLAPESPRYGYVHAVALHDAGRPGPALAALGSVLARRPYDAPALEAYVAYALEQGRARDALPHARRLAELHPANADIRRLVERLELAARR